MVSLSDTSFDLETLGKRAGCIVLSIGAVDFSMPPTPGLLILGEEFYCNIDPEDSKRYGLFEDEDTKQFWDDQSDEAKAVLLPDRLPLADALEKFREWWSHRANNRLWAKGPHFDHAILEAAYHAIGQEAPWSYRAPRDVRTVDQLAALANVVAEVPFDGIPHYALDDAKHQAITVATKAWRIIDQYPLVTGRAAHVIEPEANPVPSVTGRITGVYSEGAETNLKVGDVISVPEVQKPKAFKRPWYSLLWLFKKIPGMSRREFFWLILDAHWHNFSEALKWHLRRKKLSDEWDGMAYRFSCVLEMATGGLMSKNNYDLDTMRAAIVEHEEQLREQGQDDYIEALAIDCGILTVEESLDLVACKKGVDRMKHLLDALAESPEALEALAMRADGETA